MYIQEIIKKAEEKAGNKSALARAIKEQRPRVSEYETLARKPTDVFVLKIADYLGLDKGKTLYKVKIEIEPENAHLWEFCLNGAPDQIRTGDPRLRRARAVNLITILTQILITLVTVQRQHIVRNLNEHSALCYLYRHDPINP